MMTSLEKAVQTQLVNIQKKTGMTMKELTTIIQKSGLTKHGEIRSMLMERLGLGHGDANALVHAALKTDGTSAAEGKNKDTVLDEIYTGAKAGFRPIHEALIKHIDRFGEYEIVPKKGYVSLRRQKQFAMIGPKTNTRFEVGINAKDLKKNTRLAEQPKGSMCNYIVSLTEAEQVDSELIAWIKSAYESAG